MKAKLNIPDLKEGNYVPLIDEELQFDVSDGVNSPRQRIRNNLPGTIDFCPLVFRTEKLNNYISANLSEKTSGIIPGAPLPEHISARHQDLEILIKGLLDLRILFLSTLYQG